MISGGRKLDVRNESDVGYLTSFISFLMIDGPIVIIGVMLNTVWRGQRN